MSDLDVIKYQFRGIKCDAVDCDYKDEKAELKDYAKYLNKPCPKCGANLLTQEDHDKAAEIVKTIDGINSLCRLIIPEEAIIAAKAEAEASGKGYTKVSASLDNFEEVFRSMFKPKH